LPLLEEGEFVGEAAGGRGGLGGLLGKADIEGGEMGEARIDGLLDP